MSYTFYKEKKNNVKKCSKNFVFLAFAGFGVHTCSPKGFGRMCGYMYSGVPGSL